MALRDQPYMPLYVQDFLTDEKLAECGAESTGVYIRLMCIMHKSQTYGAILLKQKDKQTDDQVRNFASKLVRQMPYSEDVIYRSLHELIEERVLYIEEDALCQKRMVKDGKLSDIRASAGKKGAQNRSKQSFDDGFVDGFAKANCEANSEIEIEIENVTENSTVKETKGKKVKNKNATIFSDFAGDDFNLLDTLNDFEKMRKSIKKPMTERAKKMLINKLQNEFPRQSWIAVIEQSISRCWSDIYPLKDNLQAHQKRENTGFQTSNPFMEIRDERMRSE